MHKLRIGIIGGGQLGRMLTEAAGVLGHSVTVVDPSADCPAAQVGATQIIAGLKDAAAVRQLAQNSDVVTWEIEHIDPDMLMVLRQEGVLIHPTPESLAIIQDKWRQKQFVQEQDIPTALFRHIDTLADVAAVGRDMKFPLIVKARFGGFDGRANWLVHDEQALQQLIPTLEGKLVYAESYVFFAKELAVIAARGADGTIKMYPVVETIHQDHICRVVRAPAQISDRIAAEAQQIASRLLQHLHGAGVFCVELFLTPDERILVNEIAPRVHNSGHWTIEGAKTSQFEQHIRAITGEQLGETVMNVPAAVMINLLGDRTGAVHPEEKRTGEIGDGVFVHLYGKKETRPLRKMGHITALGKTVEEAEEKALAVWEKIKREKRDI